MEECVIPRRTCGIGRTPTRDATAGAPGDTAARVFAILYPLSSTFVPPPHVPRPLPTPAHAAATDAHGAGVHRHRRRAVHGAALGTAARGGSGDDAGCAAGRAAGVGGGGDLGGAVRVRDEPERHHR